MRSWAKKLALPNNMDKQKLIAIAKDQLKGGIGQDQIRELLIYRGVEESDIDTIIKAVLSDAEAHPVQASGGDIVEKTHAAILEISKEAPINPNAAKKERIIIFVATIGSIAVAIAGSILYYLYF